MPLKNWCLIYARWSESSLKLQTAFRPSCIPYISVAFFPSLKQNFIAYRSSKVSDCIFEIYRLWQSGFSRLYSNCCCNCWFEPEIIKIGQSSHKVYSNKILIFQQSTRILNAHIKKDWKLIICTSYLFIYFFSKMITRYFRKCFSSLTLLVAECIDPECYDKKATVIRWRKNTLMK